MKHVFQNGLFVMVSATFLTFAAHAEIFKCKDDKGRMTYQETPCLTATVKKLSNVPDAPIEDQIRTQARTNKILEMDRQKRAAEEAERRQEVENEKRLVLEQEAERKRKKAEALEKYKLELMERQARAAEEAAWKARGPLHCSPSGFGDFSCY
jgi:phage protein D